MNIVEQNQGKPSSLLERRTPTVAARRGDELPEEVHDFERDIEDRRRSQSIISREAIVRETEKKDFGTSQSGSVG